MNASSDLYFFIGFSRNRIRLKFGIDRLDEMREIRIMMMEIMND